MVTLNREEDLKTWEGKLKGKFVLMAPAREPAAPFSPQAKRLTDAELADLTFEADPNRAGPRLPGLSGSGAPGTGQDSGPEAAPPQPGQALPLYMSPPDPDSNRGDGGASRAANRTFVAKRMKFLIDQGVLAVLEPGRGDAGFMIVGGGGPRDRQGATGDPRRSWWPRSTTAASCARWPRRSLSPSRWTCATSSTTRISPRSTSSPICPARTNAPRWSCWAHISTRGTRHRRHRQRRGRGHRDRGRAHPGDPGAAAAADGAGCAVDRRGAGASRFARLREGSLRRPQSR